MGQRSFGVVAVCTTLSTLIINISEISVLHLVSALLLRLVIWQEFVYVTSKHKKLHLRLHLGLSAFKVFCVHISGSQPLHLTSTLTEGEQSSPTWPLWTPYSESAFAGMQSLL